MDHGETKLDASRGEGPRRRPGRGRRLVLAVAAAALLAGAWPGSARADEYDPQRAGHPLRLVAYALHPVGVALDYLLFRPAHWLVHREPLRTVFGHETDD